MEVAAPYMYQFIMKSAHSVFEREMCGTEIFVKIILT